MKRTARKKKESFFENKAEDKEDVILKDDIVDEVNDEIKVSVIEDIDNAKPEKRSKLFNRKFQIGLLIVVILLIGGSILGYSKFGTALPGQEAQNTESSNDLKDLITEVGEKILLPADENPNIATVSDITKLIDQPFFKNSENGDKVLIYPNAKFAIIYRESIGKIIAVTPYTPPPTGEANSNPLISIGSDATGSAEPTKAEKKIKVAVMNSTKTVGLAKKAADLLDKNDFEIVGTSNAEGEYETTTVSNVNKTTPVSTSKLNSIASTFSKITAKTTSLATGETAPTGADVVIILGSDFSDIY